VDSARRASKRPCAREAKGTATINTLKVAGRSAPPGNHAQETSLFEVPISEIIKIAPTNANAWSNRCLLNILSDLGTAALGDCNESLRLRPNHLPTMERRALVYFRIGKLNEAIAGFNAALELDPKRADSLYGRGVSRIKNGDVKGGNADIVEAKSIEANVAERHMRFGLK
jgi:tetratricopeptide (TPR) repeat protein